ncbi:MAG: YARHG domain-containing protein [Sphingomonadaceae bacterium]|nr:YARHG domain-containing protein [Sphingomonadaceae bacterium]
MSDVFISYSRRDQEKVTHLARAIEAEGYSVWWDKELPPHLSYGDVITDKIAAAKAAIVVWSPEAAKSEWVRAEADMARNQKKLVQTALGDVMPPLPFNQIQYANIADWQGEPDHPGWSKVKVSLAELCGGNGGAAAQGYTSAQASPVVTPAAATATSRPQKSNTPIMVGIALAALVLGTAGWFVLRPGEDTPSPVSTTDIAAAGTGSDTLAMPTEAVEILPQSSTRLLTEAEVAALGKMELRFARNEIFARNGRIFRSPELKAHFQRFSWYRPISFEVTLTDIEQQNVALLKAAEDRL